MRACTASTSSSNSSYAMFERSVGTTWEIEQSVHVFEQSSRRGAVPNGIARGKFAREQGETAALTPSRKAPLNRARPCSNSPPKNPQGNRTALSSHLRHELAQRGDVLLRQLRLADGSPELRGFEGDGGVGGGGALGEGSRGLCQVCAFWRWLFSSPALASFRQGQRRPTAAARLALRRHPQIRPTQITTHITTQSSYNHMKQHKKSYVVISRAPAACTARGRASRGGGAPAPPGGAGRGPDGGGKRGGMGTDARKYRFRSEEVG